MTLFQVRGGKEVSEAKQRASLRWLVSKAFNNKPPDDLVDLFYRDHHGLERLKPNLIHSLANAELYSLVLSQIYKDTNLTTLNNLGIIQVARSYIYRDRFSPFLLVFRCEASLSRPLPSLLPWYICWWLCQSFTPAAYFI